MIFEELFPYPYVMVESDLRIIKKTPRIFEDFSLSQVSETNLIQVFSSNKTIDEDHLNKFKKTIKEIFQLDKKGFKDWKEEKLEKFSISTGG